MKELFSLGDLYVSDFIKNDDQPRGGKVEMKMMLEEDTGAVRLEKCAPLDVMYGKYWYRSGVNQTMRNELEGITKNILSLTKLKENDIWVDIACFPERNFITTNLGLKDIKDIQLGDQVLSHDGKYHTVVKLFKRDFDGEYIKLKLKGLNVDTRCTFNHPYHTKRGWVPANELRLDDEILLQSSIIESKLDRLDLGDLLNNYQHELIITDSNISSSSSGLKNILPRYIDIDSKFTNIIGYYIGEGDSMGGLGIRFTFSKKEISKIVEVEEYFNKMNISTEIIKSGNTSYVRINSRLLSHVFENLCGHTAFNKKIPNQVINRNLLPFLIKSLWFTDGHLTLHKKKNKKDRINYVFNSVSKNLILDIWNILSSIGIVSSIQQVNNNRGFSKKDGKIFRLTIERVDSLEKFKNLLDDNTLDINNSERYTSILEITKYVDNKTVYNFEVKDTHTYVCNGQLVHNCNDGTLLSFLPKNLIRIGIDPVDDSYKIESEKHANLIIQDYFTYDAYKKSKFGGSKAKVITSIAMFYDLVDPKKFIKDIYQTLDDDGLWVLQLSYTPLMIEQMAFDNICHEHIYYYSLFNLKNLFESCGFKIVDCQLNDINGGSFRVYAMKDVGNVKKFSTQPNRDVCDFRVKSILEYEKSLNLDKVETWVDFFNKINDLKERTVSFIKEEKSKGKKIWGYGASTKGNTLLQYFGLDNTLIDGIAERSVYKWGLKTAGTDIPIYSEDDMRKANPDYLLVLPWHFISEFVERESEFLKKGGKFIVPCPKFEIIGL